MIDIRPLVKMYLARNAVLGKGPGTMSDLAALLDVDRGSLSRRLGGQRGGAAVSVEAVADALGLTVTDLIFGGRL